MTVNIYAIGIDQSEHDVPVVSIMRKEPDGSCRVINIIDTEANTLIDILARFDQQVKSEG